MLSPAFDLNPSPLLGPGHLSTAIDFTEVLWRGHAGHGKLAAGRGAPGLTHRDLEDMEPAFDHAEATRARALATR